MTVDIGSSGAHGRVETGTPLILAPIRGVTDAVYRNATAAVFGNGFDMAVAPFIATMQSGRIPDRSIADLLPANNRAWPVIPQVLSKDPPGMIELARRLYDLGYATINWNLGCPFARVAKKGRGSGLLPYPERIDEIMAAVVPEIPGRLSIKTRLGRRDAAEILDLMPVFNRYPLASLTIHPRTGIQMYTGSPDLEIFSHCLEQAAAPVIFNGDINTVRRYRELVDRFPKVSGWMMGRGAIADPFLPARIKGCAPPAEKRVAIIRRYHDMLLDAYRERLEGPGHLLDRMKGLWRYMGASFEHGADLLKTVQRCRHLKQYLDVIRGFFDDRPRWTAVR